MTLLRRISAIKNRRSLEIERTAHGQRNYNTARSNDDGPPAFQPMTLSPDTAIAS
jgi:hypothetical protein